MTIFHAVRHSNPCVTWCWCGLFLRIGVDRCKLAPRDGVLALRGGFQDHRLAGRQSQSRVHFPFPGKELCSMVHTTQFYPAPQQDTPCTSWHRPLDYRAYCLLTASAPFSSGIESVLVCESRRFVHRSWRQQSAVPRPGLAYATRCW